MKTLFRILIVITFLGIIFYYSSSGEEQERLLEGPRTTVSPMPTDSKIENLENEFSKRPQEGVSTFIHKTVDDLRSAYGEPDRIDETTFSYSWWIYEDTFSYIAFGVKDNKVCQVYTNSEVHSVSPFQMNMNVEEINLLGKILDKVIVNIDKSSYVFKMTELDQQNRLLVKLDKIFAQLYIDEETGLLNGVRFLDGETLVEMRPYEMQFTGSLPERPTFSSESLLKSYDNSAKQLFELTNIFRIKAELPELQTSESLNRIAANESSSLYKQQATVKNADMSMIKEQLQVGAINYSAIEENVAIGYNDSIEAIHGILNSKEHREIVFDESKQLVGTGIYAKYYTQILLAP